jgi:hypothetical protein
MSKSSVQRRCMFCERVVTEKYEHPDRVSPADLNDTCKEISVKLGVKVGERLICKDCCSQLVSMISSRLGS